MNDLESRRNEMINSALTYISKSASLCKQYLDETEVPVTLQELNNCVEKYCLQDIEFTAYNKALEETENLLRDSENAPDSSVEEIFKQFHAEITVNKNISRHPFMVQYKRDVEESELENEDENADGDIIASNSFVPPIDPITKTFIKNPVLNTQCGHIYENDSIRALISKKNTRCPYIGCPAMQYIHVSYLQPDNKLKNKIDHHFLNNVMN